MVEGGVISFVRSDPIGRPVFAPDISSPDQDAVDDAELGDGDVKA